MSSRLTWMLVIFGLVVLSQSGLALRCWDCASNKNVLCGDPLNITEHQATFYTKFCETGSYEPVCRKIVKRGITLDMCFRQLDRTADDIFLCTVHHVPNLPSIRLPEQRIVQSKESITKI